MYRWNEKKTLVLFLLILLVRALFSWSVPLIDDEAYHWTWTQDLMLSYYDHPGMVAWLEKIFLTLFGTSYGTVRLISFLFFTLTVIVSYRLAKELFDETVAFIASLMLIITPFWGFGGFVASPEPPFMFCFVLAAWVFWQGVKPGPLRWSTQKTWIWLGVIMGLGLNSKFIIVLLAPGFGLYLLSTPGLRQELLKKWPWLGLLITVFLCTPIFLWNAQMDWPGFKYQFYERHSGTEFSLSRWLQWLTAQLLFYTPVLYAMLLLALTQGFRKWSSDSWRWIVCLTLPSLLIFYPQPLWADYKPHWAGAAHLLLLIAAAALWVQGMTWKTKIILRPRSRRVLIGVLAFLVPLNLFLYTPFLAPWMPKVYRIFQLQKPWNPRWDLSNEFYGWEDLGKELTMRLRNFHAESGRSAFLAALRYETTAQTWWGVQRAEDNKPKKVYSLNSARSHYTVMQNARNELESLKGQDAIIVTTDKYPGNPMEYAVFDKCESSDFQTFRGSELSRTFTIWKCTRFQGVK